MIRSSLDSIERVGSKLSYSDFKDYLRAVAAAFPSGTEEYDFISDLLANAKTDVAFTRKLFSLLSEEPKITDSAPYGFSWELQSPTETGKAIFKKLEEVDDTSAHDLYEFLSYVQLNYQSAPSEEPASSENPEATPTPEGAEKPDLAVHPEDLADASDKDPLNQSEHPVQPVLMAGGTKVYRADTIESFKKFFPEAFGLDEDQFNYLVQSGGAPLVFVKDGVPAHSWHKSAGFVDASDHDITRDTAESLFGSEDLKIMETNFPELREAFGTMAPIGAGDSPKKKEDEEGKEKQPVKESEEPAAEEPEDEDDAPDTVLEAVDFLERGNIVSATIRRSRFPKVGGRKAPERFSGQKRVRAKHDLVLTIPAGMIGEVIETFGNGEVSVKFENDDLFSKPVILKDKYLMVLTDPGKNLWEEDDDETILSAKRPPIPRGATVQVRKKVKLVIPKGSPGIVYDVPDSQNLFVKFAKVPGVPVYEPLMFPSKYFVAASEEPKVPEGVQPVHQDRANISFKGDTAQERLRSMRGKIAPGVIVHAFRRSRTPGQRELAVGSVLDFNLDPSNPTSSLATIYWSDGIRSEIPMHYIQTLLFNSLDKSGAKLAVISSVKEVNDKVSFILTGLVPSKAPNAYKQLFSGKATLPKEVFSSLKIAPKVRLYSGKNLAKLFSSLATVEGNLVAVKSYRFGRTFVTDRAAVIVSSGPYGMFAVKTPVVYVKNSKGYTLFKKLGDSYISSSGHRFRSIKAAAYGKPAYLMVANSKKEFFAEQGRITCDAHQLIEKTQLILQRKAIRSAIVKQQKAISAVVASKKKIVEAAQADQAKAAELEKINQGQAATISSLNSKLIAASKKPVAAPAPESPDREAIQSSTAALLAARMSGVVGR